MVMSLPVPGTPLAELDTPALLIDLDIMESNIEKMASFFRGVSANLRPHSKTVKAPILAHKQVDAGAIGICCAKVGEAEVMVAGGIKDIFITNQIVTPEKIARLMSLGHQAKIRVAVDTADNVADLSRAAVKHGLQLEVLVEVDVGTHRSGVQAGQPALKLAMAVERAAGLKLAGLMGYEGTCVFIPDFETRETSAKKALDPLLQTVKLLEQNGISVGVVSSGGTGTYNITGLLPHITEIEAGSYIFMDGRYRSVLQDFDCALTVLATVVNRPAPDRATIDAGVKAMSTDFGLPQPKNLPGAELFGLSEEHGHIRVEQEASRLKVGDVVEIIPSHCDTTINVHDHYFGVRNGTLESVWEIRARGRFR
jgi:D-serine deaminase-like pyridoxal phosphate-dependent protein